MVSSGCVCPQDGWTALHLAAQEGRVDVVRVLTEAGAQLNILTKVHVHSITISVTTCLHRRETKLLTSLDQRDILTLFVFWK